MSQCESCKIPISPEESCKIRCRGCNLSFHWHCVNIKSKVEADLLDDKWLCNKCENKRRRSFSSSDVPLQRSLKMKDVKEVEVDAVKSMMERFVTELKLEIRKVSDGQKRMENDINTSLENCQKKLGTNEQLIQKQDCIITKQQDIINKLVIENNNLKKEVCTLRNELEITKQEIRFNLVEIRGLPMQNGETAYEAVMNLAKVLKFNLKDEMIDRCFHMKKLNEIEYPTIVVRFVRTCDKEDFLKSKRTVKNLNTGHLGMDSSTHIYINESLTSERRVLLAKVKRKKLEHGWKYLWVRSGKIFVRKSENSQIHIITNEDEFNVMCSKK